MGEYWGLSPKRFLRALEHGRFDKLLKESEPDWRRFVRRVALTPHQDRVVLCFRGLDEDGHEMRLWAVYQLIDAIQGTMRLESVVMPGDDPDSWASPPEELDGVPTFVYPAEDV